MRFIPILRWLTLLSLLVSIAVPVVAASVASQAQLVQRLEPHSPAMAELLGEKGVPIGSPTMYIISDPKAFLEGSGPEGSRLVNDAYLRENNIYPWQLKTLEFVRNTFMLGSAVAAAVFGLAWLWLSRRELRGASPERRPA